MAKFLPSTEAEKRVWLVHFKQNLPLVGATLGVNTQRLQQTDQKLDTMIANIDTVHSTEMILSSVVETRNENREEYMPEVLQLVNELKNTNGYLKSMGETLGIEPNPRPKVINSNFDIEDLSVGIKISNQKITFEFKKPRGASVIIYCRRSDEDFVQVRQITGNSYEDIRANLRGQAMEKREYCFSLIRKDKESNRSTIYPVAALQ